MFKVKRGVDMERAVDGSFVANKNTDEVRESRIKPEDWPAWRVADGEEWRKVSETEAKVLRRGLCHDGGRVSSWEFLPL